MFAMSITPRLFIDQLGGYRAVSSRLGVKSTTLHSHITAEKMPPKWYKALCELADERCVAHPRADLFDFKPLLHLSDDSAPSKVIS